MKDSRDKQVKEICERLNENHYTDLEKWKERLRETEKALKAKMEELDTLKQDEKKKLGQK